MVETGPTMRLYAAHFGASHHALGARGVAVYNDELVVQVAQGWRGGHQWGKGNPLSNVSMAGAH
jgi:hypothetical protein